MSRINATSSTDRAMVDPVSCRSSPYHARLAATPLSPSFSGSCARPCGSERAPGSIIDAGKRGRLRVDQPTRSLDALAHEPSVLLDPFGHLDGVARLDSFVV